MSTAASSTVSGPRRKSQSDRTPWREALAPFAQPVVARSLLDIATSAVPYVALSVLMYQLLDVSYLLVLAVSIPASGFLLRTFIVFHDCAHGSFFRSKRANAWVGATFGLLVFTPFASWRHSHAVHHATSGDLDRRGEGDVLTLTVAEYYSRSWHRRLAYRLFRNPLVMFGLGPIWSMVIAPRIVPRSARRRLQHSVILVDLALAAGIAGLCLWIGWDDYLLVQIPTVMLAGAAGIWLFYVQHQFEDTYWQSSDEWSYAEAALRGSSYLKLPKVLQFFTGNIGLHHVHHLSARVPNYNLPRAHEADPMFADVPTLTGWEGLLAVRLKLWDEDSGRLVNWRDARRAHRRVSGTA
jgi:acyl-lipid omega-6 desaturase (Delta-12 desaturase)